MSNKINKSKMKKENRLCLGEGEVIGHKHIVESAEGIEYENKDTHIKFYVTKSGVLTHDEHDRMVFGKGLFYSYNQVEYNPMTDAISRVFD